MNSRRHSNAAAPAATPAAEAAAFERHLQQRQQQQQQQHDVKTRGAQLVETAVVPGARQKTERSSSSSSSSSNCLCVSSMNVSVVSLGPPSQDDVDAASCAGGGPLGSGCLNPRIGGGIVRSQQVRPYLHFARTTPEDYELPIDTMPEDVERLMKTAPKDLDFFGNYWYWRLRGEATILDPETLPKKSYKQLARDMGLQVVNEESEHMVGLLELYEYLKQSPFVGPFGTIENPVLDRWLVWLAKVPWLMFRDFLRGLVSDVFNLKALEKAQRQWNSGDYVQWPLGEEAVSRLFLQGQLGNEVPEKLSAGLKALE
ncbi:hypothetical protein Emag_000250 [Eimeria magna]